MYEYPLTTASSFTNIVCMEDVRQITQITSVWYADMTHFSPSIPKADFLEGWTCISLALYFDELLKQLTYIPCNNTRCKNIPGGMIVYKLPWTANCAVGVHSGVQMCYEHPLNKSAAC